MNLYDMHADTPHKIFKLGTDFSDERLHISAEKIKDISDYRQFFAIWCDKEHDNETVYENFLKIRDNFIKCLENDFPPNLSFNFSVEDARLLNGKIERLDVLKNSGVKILTLTWQGDSVIGGAYDTENGLTEFGKEVVYRCFDLGIVPDVSHASRRIISELSDISAEKQLPFIATHSNSFSVYPHKRNLTDEDFIKIKDSGGIVGISFAPEHICESKAHICDIIRHIEHYLSLNGEDAVCLGCDFDGISTCPVEIPNISYIYLLKDELYNVGYTTEQIEKLFFENAFNFANKYIKQRNKK